MDKRIFKNQYKQSTKGGNILKHKKIISSIIILIVLFTITACSTDNIDEEIKVNYEEENIVYEPIKGGQIVLPLTNLSTLNPLMTENISYYHFGKLIFEGLFQIGNNLNVIPQLAEDYSITDEGKTIVVKLKKGVSWHDGSEFTSKDVGFTISTLKYGNETSSYYNMFQATDDIFSLSGMSIITDFNIIDDYTIEIYFKDGASNNLELLTFPIIPQHVFSESKNTFASALELENYVPIGTGPYKFVGYEKFKNVSLTAFSSYRDGEPYITNIDGKVLEDDKLIVTAFETGQLSMANSLGVDWDKYKSNNRIKIVEYISNNYEFIGFNFEKEIFQEESGLAIRKAINYGIDRQAIISKIYLGHASQIDVPIHPDSWLLTDDANTYGYSIEKAKEVLNQAKWLDRDNDGILENENGEKLTIKILTNGNNQLRLNTTNMLVDDLKKLGFEVIKDYGETYFQSPSEESISTQWEVIERKISEGEFDLVVLGWEMAIIPNYSSMFHSLDTELGDNFIRYRNEKMDELLLNIHSATNREYKKRAYSYLQEFMVNELPYISLFYKNRALLVDTRIQGDLNPTFFNPYNGLENCFIPQDLR